MKVQIGKTSEGVAVQMDVQKLVEQRLLITATSGGGKSMTQRLVAEVTDGVLPRIILDPEGEFSSLREKFEDFVIAGKGRDVPADARTAPLLARRALELNLNLIIDLYELSHDERHRVVRLFLDGILDAPKPLWGPRLIMLDEAHKFIPEKGEGSSEARAAGIRLLDSGRKRGLGTVLATQRLSKLSKDAAAECWNKMVGPTAWGDDRQRAAEEIGIPRKDQDLFRTLKPGEFIGAGPALFQDPTKILVASPKTSHPKAGNRARAKAQAPSAKVKAVLAKLSDLPKEADQEAKTLEELRNQIRDLKRQLANVPKPTATIVMAKFTEKELKAIRDEYQKEVNKVTLEMDRRRIQEIREAVASMKQGIHAAIEAAVKKHNVPPAIPKLVVLSPAAKSSVSTPRPVENKEIRRTPPAGAPAENKGVFGACERKIVGFLCLKPDRTWTKVQVAVGAGYSWNSGGFNNALGKLRSAGAITGGGDALKILDPSVCPGNLPSTDVLGAWRNNLGKCEKAIWDILLEDTQREFTKEELGEKTQYSPDSGGFNNALGRLNSLGLIKRTGGKITLNQELLEI